MRKPQLSTLRRKRVIVPAVAAAAVIGVGGVAWSASAGDDLRGNDRDRAATVAVEAAGGGTVTDAETSDDRGVVYEVEVTREDGTEVDVELDGDYQVVRVDEDDRDGTDDDRDADDRVLDDAERTSAEQAAQNAVGGGIVTDVEASDDAGEAYEVEVVTEDGREWKVALDADFGVVEKKLDD